MKRLTAFGFAILVAGLLCGCASGPDAKYFFERGFDNENQGNYEQAMADYTQAIRLDPNYSTPYMRRGCLYSEMGEYDKAIADLTQAIAIAVSQGADATNSLVNYWYIERGKAYYLKDNREMAIGDFDEAIRVHESSASSIRSFLEDVQSDLISRYPIN